MPFVTDTNLGAAATQDMFAAGTDQGEQGARNVLSPSRLTFTLDSDQVDATVRGFVTSSRGEFVFLQESGVLGGGTLGTPISIPDFGQSFVIPPGTLHLEVTAGGAASDFNLNYSIQSLQ